MWYENETDTTTNKICQECSNPVPEDHMYWRIEVAADLQTRSSQFNYLCSDDCLFAAGYSFEVKEDEPNIELLAGKDFDLDTLEQEYAADVQGDLEAEVAKAAEESLLKKIKKYTVGVFSR